jgi:hypothetical protein
MIHYLKVLLNNKFILNIAEFLVNGQIELPVIHINTIWWPNQNYERLNNCKISVTRQIKLKFASHVPQTLT